MPRLFRSNSMCSKANRNHHKVDLYSPEENMKTFNTNLMRNLMSFRRTSLTRFGPDQPRSFGPIPCVAEPAEIITKWTCTCRRKK